MPLAALLILGVSSSQAYLLQAWNKTLPANTYLSDLTVDSAGNTIVASGGSAKVYVKKVAPTGGDLWTATIQGAQGGFSSRSVAVDTSGAVYVEYIDYGTTQLFLRKLRGSDGANLGTVEMPGPLFILQTNSRQVVDGANNVYWVASANETNGQLSLRVANINSAALPASTFRTHHLPSDSRILEIRPRPGGGVLVLAGVPLQDDPLEENFISTLYSFEPTGVPKQFFAGSATTFAIVPGTNDLIFAGGRQGLYGSLVRHRIGLDGVAGLTVAQNLGVRPAFFRDLHVTKSGVGVAAGGFLEDSSNNVNAAIMTFAATGLANGGSLKYETPNTFELSVSVKGDNYDGVTCVENYDRESLRVREFDALTGLPIHSRTYAGLPSSPDPVHAVNAAGFIGVGMGNRIVGLKPRDLKDIYMGNTTYQGGATATAIIRMYEPYTYDRAVNLSDGGSPYVTIAASKVIVGGQTQVSATVLTNPVPSTQNITLSAKFGNQARTFAFTLTP